MAERAPGPAFRVSGPAANSLVRRKECRVRWPGKPFPCLGGADDGRDPSSGDSSARDGARGRSIGGGIAAAGRHHRADDCTNGFARLTSRWSRRSRGWSFDESAAYARRIVRSTREGLRPPAHVARPSVTAPRISCTMVCPPTAVPRLASHLDWPNAPGVRPMRRAIKTPARATRTSEIGRAHV